jgi:pilus assembly protein CpaB
MSRRVLLFGLTLLLALSGTAGVLAYVRHADARAVAGKRTVSVLVTTKKVAAGTTVAQARHDGLLRTEDMPAETVPGDTFAAVADLDSIGDQVAADDIVAGQLVRRPMFVARSAAVGGLTVPDGKLVLTVAVGTAAEVAGYLEPGSKVAVFDTYTVAEGTDGKPAGDDLERNHKYDQATRLLLSKVTVLAVGPAPAERKAATAGAADAAKVLVTVAVTQYEAERLVHGAQVGHLYLALVPDGSEPIPSDGVDNNTVFGAE